MDVISFANGFEIDGSSSVETIAQSTTATGNGADLSLSAQNGGSSASGNGGSLYLNAGNAGSYPGAIPGNIVLHAGSSGLGTTEIYTSSLTVTLSGSSTGQHILARPTSFQSFEDILWSQFQTSSGSAVDIEFYGAELDLTSYLGGADGGFIIDFHISASGGTTYERCRRNPVKRVSSDLTIGAATSISDTLTPSPTIAISNPSAQIIRYALTPGNSTLTTWTVKLTVRAA